MSVYVHVEKSYCSIKTRDCNADCNGHELGFELMTIRRMVMDQIWTTGTRYFVFRLHQFHLEDKDFQKMRFRHIRKHLLQARYQYIKDNYKKAMLTSW